MRRSSARADTSQRWRLAALATVSVDPSGSGHLEWPRAEIQYGAAPWLFSTPFWSVRALACCMLCQCSRCSRFLMDLVVDSMKNRVGMITNDSPSRPSLRLCTIGRLRPDFLDRCKWDAVANRCTGYAPEVSRATGALNTHRYHAAGRPTLYWTVDAPFHLATRRLVSLD